MAVATPSSTAYGSGIISVPAKVMNMTVRGTRPVCQTVRMAVGLMVWNPTTMSIPASAGIAISFTRSASSSTMIAMSTPQKTLRPP